MSQGVSIRAAGVEDIEAMRSLQREYPQILNWTDTQWAGLMSGEVAPARRIWLAEVEKAVKGFVVLGVVGNVAEFEMVLVDETMRGLGVGRSLCEAAMRSAREDGAEHIELEVRESNAAARVLYRSLGFSEQGRRRNYYHHPSEDAVLMGATL